MNAFRAVAPEQEPISGRYFDVQLYLDPDGDYWIAESDDLPVATEAPSLDQLISRVWEIAPEIAELNGHPGPLKLRFVLRTTTPA